MIKIFNTYSGKKEKFIALQDKKLKMYVCGPTVYDNAHLGHGRSAVSFDVIRRYFIYKGYKVKYVSNYTDIDDKMINRAREENISVEALANKIIPEYEKDYALLEIMDPDIKPKATEYIEEMIQLIQRLENLGFTYVLDDGVYYDVTKFAAYGELSKQDLKNLQMGARVEVKKEKKNPYDFVLWKFKKEGEPFWPSPWGEGRPGWHIECSAMTWKHLGEIFDIHGGGLDLTFPHHECEIAQSQPVFGKDSFARYWMHNGFINVDNEKMSKSLGNFFTLRDIFKKYNAKVVRFMYLQTHYRNPINFSLVLLEQAKAALQRIHDFVRNITVLGELPVGKKAAFSDKKAALDKEAVLDKEAALDKENLKIKQLIIKAKRDFEKSMDDDMDSSGALGAIFELIKSINFLLKNFKISRKSVNFVLEFLKNVDQVLGVIFYKDEVLDEGIEKLIRQREIARENKNFVKADEIRKQLLDEGIGLEDTPQGTIWKKI